MGCCKLHKWDLQKYHKKTVSSDCKKRKSFFDYGWHGRLLLYRTNEMDQKREDYTSFMHNKALPVMSDDLILEEVCIGKYQQ